MNVDMAQLMLIANEWMWLTYLGKNEDDWGAIGCFHGRFPLIFEMRLMFVRSITYSLKRI